MKRPDTKDIPTVGYSIRTAQANACCPFCGSENQHFVAHNYTDYFDGHFRQGCLAALILVCESDPTHLYTFLVGEHKGNIWTEVVGPEVLK
jgi:hypothetical protein